MTELDRLLVRIEADIRPLEQALTRVSQRTAETGKRFAQDLQTATHGAEALRTALGPVEAEQDLLAGAGRGLGALSEQLVEADGLARRTGDQLGGVLDESARGVLILADTIEGVLGRALTGSIDSWDDLRRVALGALDDILRAVFKTIEASSGFGSSGGGGFGFGGLGDLFGGFGSFGSLFGGGSDLGGGFAVNNALGGSGFDFNLPGLSAGGPVQPGRLYEVGEGGRELFIPSVPGRVLPSLPSDRLLAGLSGGGGVQVNNRYSIDARGAQPGVGAEIVAALDARSARIKSEAVDQVYALMDRGGRFAKRSGRRRG